MVVERIEDTRANQETHLIELRSSMDQRFERISERIEKLNEEFRQLEFKVSNVGLSLDELRQTDAGLRRELWSLHEQRIRIRLEQVQQELENASGSRRSMEAQVRVPEDPAEPKTIRSLDL
jgi:chromosome segregation ATPase